MYFADGRPVLTPNNIEVAVAVKLQIKSTPLQSVPVAEDFIDLQPLLNVTVFVYSVQPLAVNHLCDAVDDCTMY